MTKLKTTGTLCVSSSFLISVRQMSTWGIGGDQLFLFQVTEGEMARLSCRAVKEWEKTERENFTG